MHHYHPPPLDPSSSSKHRTTAETSAQTLDAIAFVRSNSTSSTDTSIALLRRLAYQSEAAMTRADIESIEKQDI